MICRGDASAGAVFSLCDSYRYRLWRVWDESKSKLCFIMLNPSTATHEKLDPTVSRCKKRAEALGYGGLEVVNLFALRSTDPKALYRSHDPHGPDNIDAIFNAVKDCAITICAWGGHGSLHDTGNAFKVSMLSSFPTKTHYLKLNCDGSPAHPLYLPYSMEPVLWSK